jgi:uncharacterized membrane protein YfcA
VELPDYPTLFWVTAVFAMILIGISKAGFGGGVGAIATPLMALTISVADAAAILLPILIVADIFSLRHYWNVYDRNSLKLMLPGALVGILLGAIFFGYFSDNERTLKFILGVVSLIFVAYQLARSLIMGACSRASRPSGPVCCLVAQRALRRPWPMLVGHPQPFTSCHNNCHAISLWAQALSSSLP